MQLAAASNNLDAARALAEHMSGTLYCDEREQWQHLPFRALVTVATDDIDAVSRVGDVGAYTVFRRLVKAGTPETIALFPLIRRADLSHVHADAHWRDQHAPLALEHHAHMTHYTQLSVVANLSGLELDGFALCGFASVDDLRNRFYTSPESVNIIAEDVRQFADISRSPPRLIASEHRYTQANVS
jgi:hypothetical protein|tara:strand:+ start:1306 stop:1863 length:558 start_codon:yes stop_codon:yes gene_type:complete